MSRQIDQAADIEALHREAALSRQAEAARPQADVSAYECEECGEPIPEARRQAILGCRCCIDCQTEIEQYGKTRFAASRH